MTTSPFCLIVRFSLMSLPPSLHITQICCYLTSCIFSAQLFLLSALFLSLLISAAFQLEIQMNILHHQNITWHLLCAIASPPHCLHDIHAISFILTRKQRERQPCFPPSFLLQTRLSLFLITVHESWALIRVLYLTNRINDVRSPWKWKSHKVRPRFSVVEAVLTEVSDSVNMNTL